MSEKTDLMLRALLKQNKQLWLIGSYCSGLTADNDPYILLFPAYASLKEKVCRVYDSMFYKLPNFVTFSPSGISAGKSTHNKESARGAGLLTYCQPFEILTHDGKITQMGPERRFFNVLSVLPFRYAGGDLVADKEQPYFIDCLNDTGKRPLDVNALRQWYKNRGM